MRECLFIRLRDATPHAAPRDRRVAVGAIAVIAAIVLAAAVVVWSPWFAGVAAICITASIFVHLHSRLKIKNLFGIWLFLWLLLPPPLNLDRNLIQYLQSLSSRLSSAVLDLLGINHVMLGNVLESASKQFFVDEACSGIVSVMSILAAGTIYAVYRNRSLWHLCWLLTLGVGMAVVMNLARIVTIAVAYDWWQWDLTTGTPHEILGLVLFLCTFGSLVCLDELLATMFGRIEVFETTEEKSRLVSIFNRRIAAAASDPPVTETPSSSNRPSIPVPTSVWVATLCMLPLGIWSALPREQSETGVGPYDQSWVTHVSQLEQSFLPAKLGNWIVADFEVCERELDSQFGQYSRIYRLTRDDSPSIVTLSVDFPFYDQHELTVCYRNIGWQMIDRNAVFVDAEQLAEQAIIRARFESAEGHGLLLFGHLDGKGELLAPRYVMDSGSTFHRLFARFRQQEGTFNSRGVTQVQAWVTGPIEVREEIEAEIREIFVEFRERVSAFLAAEAS